MLRGGRAGWACSSTSPPRAGDPDHPRHPDGGAARWPRWQSANTRLDGEPYTVLTGQRFKGDHPVVAKLGTEVFVPDGTPLDEMPSPFENVEVDHTPRHEQPSQARIDPSTPLKDLRVCIWGIEGSPSCDEGAIVHRDDELVQRLPQAFVPLADRLGVRRS